jgi:hypothetical protein
LHFIGEHGACAILPNHDQPIKHPELTVDTSILDAVYLRACDLILKSGINLTHNGRDLQSGELFLKPERKFTSFCIVRTMNGFEDHLKDGHINTLNETITRIMSVLDTEFNLTTKLGWSKTIGADAQEFAQSGFDKIGGIQWIESQKGLEEKTHFMFEDSNPKLLEWLGKNRNAFNFAVGNGLDQCLYIHGKLSNINATWGFWEAMAQDLQQFNGVRVATLRHHTRRLAA